MSGIDPNNDALGPDERELARILRALPMPGLGAGEPPATLDARILRAAADAAAASPARRRRTLGLFGGGSALWGIGTAAAAVLALGIGWHAMYGDRPLLPRSSPVPLPTDAASDEGIPVEFRDRTSLAQKASESAGGPRPPPPAMADPTFPRPHASTTPTRARPVAAAAAPAAPVPEPFADTGLDEHVAARAESNVTADAAFATAEAEVAAPARAAAAGEMRRDAVAAGGSAKIAAQSAGALANRAGQAADAAKPSGNGSRLRPASWLAQVRSLRDAGNTAQARARLVEFRKAYPHWVIPTDLAPLLEE